MTNVFGSKWKFAPIRFLVPIGISFYTLEIISYLTDVYRGTIKAEHNFAKVALYLSFFRRQWKDLLQDLAKLPMIYMPAGELHLIT